MPDSKRSKIQVTNPEEATAAGEDEVCHDDYARVIRDGTTTLILVIRWHPTQSVYEIHEEDSDLILERSTGHGNAHRLADMYLDGFREGYDRGYQSAEAERAAGDADPYRIRRHTRTISYPAQSDRRDRDDDQGHAEGDGPGR